MTNPFELTLLMIDGKDIEDKATYHSPSKISGWANLLRNFHIVFSTKNSIDALDIRSNVNSLAVIILLVCSN